MSFIFFGGLREGYSCKENTNLTLFVWSCRKDDLLYLVKKCALSRRILSAARFATYLSSSSAPFYDNIQFVFDIKNGRDTRT